MPPQPFQSLTQQARQIAEETFEQAKEQTKAGQGQMMEQLGAKAANQKQPQQNNNQPPKDKQTLSSPGDFKQVVDTGLKQMGNEPGAMAGQILEHLGISVKPGSTAQSANIQNKIAQQEEQVRKKANDEARWRNLRKQLDEEIKKYEQLREQLDIQREKQEEEEKKKVEQIKLQKQQEQPAQAEGKGKPGAFGTKPKRVKNAQDQAQAEKAGSRVSG